MKKRTSDAIEIIDSMFGGDPDWERNVQEEELNARVAQSVYALRVEAGLTQEELGKKIGVKQPMISKLENADYSGSTLDMLFRICTALRKQFDYTCLGDKKPRRTHPTPVAAA